jgi:hypothetical protein
VPSAGKRLADVVPAATRRAHAASAAKQDADVLSANRTKIRAFAQY